MSNAAITVIQPLDVDASYFDDNGYTTVVLYFRKISDKTTVRVRVLAESSVNYEDGLVGSIEIDITNAATAQKVGREWFMTARPGAHEVISFGSDTRLVFVIRN